jgi:hypothetical protein
VILLWAALAKDFKERRSPVRQLQLNGDGRAPLLEAYLIIALEQVIGELAQPARPVGKDGQGIVRLSR